MDVHGTDADGIGAAPSVARLLLELRGRVNVDVRPAGRSLQVRPAGSTGTAVYIHPGGVDVAVERTRAADVASAIEGASVKEPDDPVPFVAVDANLIDANYDALLSAAVQAVELVAAGRPAKVRATATKAAKAAKPAKAARPVKVVRPDPPRCPVCKQYELLASGECPSGYC